MTTTTPQTARSRSTEGRRRADDQFVLATSAVLVTPVSFATTLLLTMSVGAVNAAIVALVPALFSAGFFGGLCWLVGAVKRDEGMALPASRRSYENSTVPAPGSRAA